MLRLLDVIEQLLDNGTVEISREAITNIELSYLKSALRAKITNTEDGKYCICAFWKFEGN